MDKPYLGLRPYTEQDQDYFFGRENDRRILTDKILSNRLTLLFAASGVGKSSLLRASVLPYLQHPQHKNLDVVYCNDWVVDPIHSLQQHTLEALILSGSLATDMTMDKLETNNLNEFFQFCALFTRQPLVIILDQFEEFFLYNKHTKEFKNFITQFSVAISDPATPVTVVISMREDFAMELNHFKAKLSTLLFENFYRLDKLTIENARQAIIDPVEKIGFHYEEGLVDELLNDFAVREVIGDRSKPLPELIDTVEPAYLQIVCSQLWDLDKNNPDKILTRKSYTKSGRATGLLKSYVESVISHFSENEKKIASKAFDHLVSRYGTKVAYTAADLSPVVRIKQPNLERVLEQLDKARILRSQSREGIVWYELHHDLFSKSVGEWNQNFKAKQRSKRAILVCMGAIAGSLLLYAAYDYGINSASHHLRLSTRSNDNEIELYHGRQGSRDLFGIQKYIAQTGYQKGELEPDKVFTDRTVGRLEDLDVELIEHLQRFKRFERYMQTGKFVRAEKLIKYYLDVKDYDKVRKLTEVLPSYPTQQGIDILQSVLNASNDNSINRFVIQKMGELPSRKTAKILTEQMNQVDDDSLRLTLNLLGQFGYEESFPALVEYLNHSNPALRQTTFNALKTAEHPDLHNIIKQLLKDASPDEKVNMIDLLSKVGTTIEGGNFRTVILNHLTPDQPAEVRITALKALQNTQHNEISATLSELLDGQDNELKIEAINILKAQKLTSANRKLVALLSDNNADVRDSAASALASLSNKQTTPLLIKKLNTLTDDKAIISVINILGEIGGSDAVKKLLSFQQTTQQNDLKIATIKALGKIDSTEIILPLSTLLSHRETAIRTAAENALGTSKHKQATEALIRDFDKFNTEKFHLLKLLLDKQETDALRAVLKLLAHKEYEVRLTVLLSLGEFDRNLQGNNIDQDKIAEELISLLTQPHWTARNNAMSVIADRNFFNLEKLHKTSKEHLIVAIRSQLIDGKPWIEEPVSAVQERRFLMNHARALGKFNQADAIPALMSLKFQGEKLIGKMAEDVLENMQGMEVNTVLFSYLENHDSEMRRYALELLKGKKDISFPPSLIDLIDSKDSVVRSNVVSILSKLARSDEKSYGEILVTQLKNESNPQVQQSIIQSLSEIKYKEALPTILSFFTNTPSLLKRSAIAAASQLGDSSIRPALLKSLEDNDQDVRYDSAVALAKLDNEKDQQTVIPILREQIRDLTGLSDIYDVQQTSQFSNQQTIHQTNQETKSPEDTGKTNSARTNEIIELLGKAADQESIDLLRELVDKKDMSANRKFIIKALAESKDPQTIDLFIDGLYGDNKEVYVKALKKINSPDLIQKLADRLGNPDLRIQRITINTLGNLSDPRALPVLLEQLENTKTEIQLACMEALGNIGDHHAESKLLKFVKEKNQGLRNSAINALGQIHSKAAIPVLLEKLTTKPSSSDQYIVNALGQIATSLNAGEPRQKILSALIKRLDQRIRDSLPAETDLKAAIVDNLGKMKARETTPQLLEMLRSLGTSGQQTRALDDNRVFQTALIRTLGDLGYQLGDKKEGLLLDYFSQLVTDRNTNISLQTEAMLALTRINPASPKTIKALKSILVLPLSDNDDQDLEHITNSNLYLAQIMSEPDSKIRHELIEKLITALNQTEERMKLAKALSRVPADWSMAGLIILADDIDIKVKKLAVGAIKSILYENEMLIAPLLATSDHDPEIRSAAIRALGKQASSQTRDNASTAQLEAIATNLDRPVTDRAIALSVLNDNSGDDIPSILLDVMKKDTGDLSSSGYFYLTVTNKNSPAALAYLKSQLNLIDQQYAQYRKQRDKLEEGSNTTESITPPEFPWQFQIASAIASMSPEDGIALLSHNLARVRYGAVSGLQTLGDITLLKKLITLYKSRKQSLASFAAYRVIDETLKVIQYRGNTDNLESDLNELRSLQSMTRGLDGVHARLEWTIDQLADKQTRQSRMVSG